MLPFLRESLRDGAAQGIASTVFGSLGDSTWQREMRAALREAQPRFAVDIASEMADSGDVVALDWIRRALRDPRMSRDTVPLDDMRRPLDVLLFAAEQHPDTANIDALLALLRDTKSVRVLRALWAMKSLPVRIATIHAVENEPALLFTSLDFAMHWGDTLRFSDSSGRGVLTRATLRALDDLAAYAEVDSTLRQYSTDPKTVSEMATRLREPAAIPYLIRMVGSDWWYGDAANEALIRLTGAEPPRVDWYHRGEVRAYWDRWAKAHPTFAPVSPPVGDRAYQRWFAKAVRK
jgi:hypothetical protein